MGCTQDYSQSAPDFIISGFESLAVGLSGVRCVEVINIMPASRCDILTPKEQRIVIERADMQARIVTETGIYTRSTEHLALLSLAPTFLPQRSHLPIAFDCLNCKAACPI